MEERKITWWMMKHWSPHKSWIVWYSQQRYSRAECLSYVLLPKTTVKSHLHGQQQLETARCWETQSCPGSSWCPIEEFQQVMTRNCTTRTAAHEKKATEQNTQYTDFLPESQIQLKVPIVSLWRICFRFSNFAHILYILSLSKQKNHWI